MSVHRVSHGAALHMAIECAICYGEMSSLDRLVARACSPLPCQHAPDFHWRCLRTWLRSAHACPVCRRDARAPSPGGVWGRAREALVEGARGACVRLLRGVVAACERLLGQLCRVTEADIRGMNLRELRVLARREGVTTRELRALVPGKLSVRANYCAALLKYREQSANVA